MKKLAVIIIALFSAAALVSAQQKQRVAVLPSVGDLDPPRLILLTDKVREIATKNLPMENFNILKQDVITKLIGEEELYRSCKEGVCIGDLAKKTDANYGARCDIVKLDDGLVMKFELYSVNEEAIFETFTDYNVKDFHGMLASLEARLPATFQKMVYKTVYDKALADARDKALEQQRQENTLPKPLVPQPMFVPEPTPTPEPAAVIQQPAPQTIEQTEVPKVKKPRKKHGFYFAPKFMLGLGEFTGALGVGAEIGWTFSNRMFFGIDIGPPGFVGEGNLGGSGLSLGGVYDLPVPQMHFAYGGSVGFWRASEDRGHHGEGDYERRDDYNFLAPFIRWRYKFIELSYRGLLGTYSKSKEIRRYDINNGYYDYDYDEDEGFGWNNHQIMLGLYFGGR